MAKSVLGITPTLRKNLKEKDAELLALIDQVEALQEELDEFRDKLDGFDPSTFMGRSY